MKKYILMLLLTGIYSASLAQGDVTGNGTLKENPVLIGKQRSFTISGTMLGQDPVLRMPEAYADYHIMSYELSYLPSGNGRELLGPFKIEGNSLTTGAARDILQRIRPGDRLFFEEIRAVSTHGNKQPLKLAAAVMVQ